MGLHLRHRVQCYADNDQQCCPTEVKRHVEVLDQDRRQDAYDADVDGAEQSYSRQNTVDILGGEGLEVGGLFAADDHGLGVNARFQGMLPSDRFT